MDRDEFDKEMNKVTKLATYGFIIYVVVVLAIIGFGAWVIVQVLQHFEVI